MSFFNPVTNHEFSASNQRHLQEAAMLFGFDSKEVAGFNQWKKEGRKIIKGQKANKIYIVCERKDEKSGEKKEVVKTINVFFKDQTEK